MTWMNNIGWLVIGWLIGTVSTYWFFIIYAKYMDKTKKEAAISVAREKWQK